MSALETGGPAFPIPVMKQLENYYQGVTMRDYFATKAMQGLLAADTEFSMNAAQIAKYAYEQADAMLEARKS